MTEYNVIVIGGGPAGLMAAGKAAQQGAKTLLIEKMNRPGRKLSITGKGRCNITNKNTLDEFITHFGKNGHFLRQSFANFFTSELVDFFKERGVDTVIQRGGRIFPAGGQALEVVDVLINWIRASGVNIINNSKAENLIIEKGRITGVGTINTSSPKTKKLYSTNSVIIATGGASYPATGSNGDGFLMIRKTGHSIVPIRPALVPLETTGGIDKRIQGLNLKNTSVCLLINGKKKKNYFGEMCFTSFGISGPIILSMSKQVVDALRVHQTVSISIDLKPALDQKKLNERLIRELNSNGKKQFQTILKTLLPKKLIPVCIDLIGISPKKPAHQITSQERSNLGLWLKNFHFDISGYRPFTEAIITAGGVYTKEINPRTMMSTIVKGLFFAGEVIDIDADTGGYNLQAAFSTGWMAGREAGTYPFN